MNIRLANKNDIEDINNLFKKVVKDMKTKKIEMWNYYYPFCEFEKDINSNTMYIIQENNKIIGAFALNDFESSDFNSIEWMINNEKWTSINRFAISPEMQGKGYAKKSMKVIEEITKKNGYKVIRLTVWEKNEIAIQLYETYGFKKVTNGSYTINDMLFIGYEKQI